MIMRVTALLSDYFASISLALIKSSATILSISRSTLLLHGHFIIQHRRYHYLFLYFLGRQSLYGVCVRFPFNLQCKLQGYCFMLLSTIGVQCGPQDVLVAIIRCISSPSPFSSLPLLSQIPWLSLWSEALIAHLLVSAPQPSTIRMEVILPVMTATTIALLLAWIFRHACHVKFKARQFP